MPSDRDQDRDRDRLLRQITIYTLLPSVPFLLAHGIMTHILCPVLGIIPMTISAVSGIWHVWGGTPSRAVSGFVDVFVAGFLLGILFPGWIFMVGNGAAVEVILGTYGTVGMIGNFLFMRTLV
ncbi:hypothetical protein DOTSEDRAFT_46827 [Dothistroma septosporum NZE10]|uniref:Uncharacterized protein n=1 Tax=Dothistroma septosporum (strain NZE10 / CBS 128990) TaxID=675120 RepID=N1PCZ3_DOTSN|nr:hypothetical protein DOTSEDRAFT_46827 [Dothistroma septosporum NZE10]